MLQVFVKYVAAPILLVLALAMIVTAARAEVWVGIDNDGDTTRLTDEPCTDQEILKHVHESVREYFKAGTSVVGGVKFDNCWRRYGSLVFFIYADGDKGAAPWSTLKPEL